MEQDRDMENSLNKFTTYIRELQKKQMGLIALEGTWGSGKSYLLNSFLTKIEEINRSIIRGENSDGEKYSYLIRFNAWQYNDDVNPFISLLEVILKYLDDTLEGFSKDEKQKHRVEKIKIVFSKILEALSIPAVFLPKGGSVISEILLNQTKNEEKRKNRFTTARESYNKVREGLEELSSNNNVILIIDDLDRCFPNVQLKLLESLHHICDGANYITIVSLVPEQLETSLEKIYGNKMDVNNYISKVFNGRFILDNAVEKKRKLVEIKRKYPKQGYSYGKIFDDIIQTFSECNQFTMRDIEKARQIVENVLPIVTSDRNFALDDSWPLQLFLLACAYSVGDRVLNIFIDKWPELRIAKEGYQYQWFFNRIRDCIMHELEYGIFALSLAEDTIIDAIKSTVYVRLDEVI